MCGVSPEEEKEGYGGRKGRLHTDAGVGGSGILRLKSSLC